MKVEYASSDRKQAMNGYTLMYDVPLHYEEVLVDGTSVSHAGSVQREMRIGSSIVKLGLITDVATSPRHRTYGYSTSCMTRQLRHFEDRGDDVSVVFGISDFYDRCGYAPCFPEHRLTLNTRDAEEAPRLKGYSVREFADGDIDWALQVFNDNNRRRSATVVRKSGEWLGFVSGLRSGYPPPSLVLERGGSREAYVSFHRSTYLEYPNYPAYDEDLQVCEIGLVGHDCLGTILNELALRALERRLERIILNIPLDHPMVDFSRRFGAVSAMTYHRNGRGMMRLVNQRTLFQKLREELQDRVSWGPVSQGDIEIKTELGLTRIEVVGGELSVGEGPARGGNVVELPQSILAQLIIGYRSADNVLRDEASTIRGDPRLLRALFPTSFPNVSLDYAPLDIF
jgi:hypothetical protein